jgi:hypothetical protein
MATLASCNVSHLLSLCRKRRRTRLRRFWTRPSNCRTIVCAQIATHSVGVLSLTEACMRPFFMDRISKLSKCMLHASFNSGYSPSGPRWASMNLGILICLNCSGIHRRLGVHISKVKSVTLDGWKVKWAQVRHMCMGNSSICLKSLAFLYTF